jgi:hypothetical protein
MGFGLFYKSGKVSRNTSTLGFKEIVKGFIGFRAKTLPWVGEGYFGNFTLLGQNFEPRCWGHRSGFQFQVLGFNWSK